MTSGRVRLHPYNTERVLDGVRSLADVTTTAALHHERLDGSGYTRAAPAAVTSAAARFLAAADVYAAMTEERPHRAAPGAEVAAGELRAESSAGLLDARAVEAVLQAAGHRPRRRSAAIAGLTVREIEVLGMLARGRTSREIAEILVVSIKTIDAHVQHVYAKAGVTTRAGATLFAAHHGLLADS